MADGVTYAELASRLGVSRSTIRRAAAQVGVVTTPGQATLVTPDQASAIAAIVGQRVTADARHGALGAARDEAGAPSDAVRIAQLEGEVARLQAVVAGLERELEAATATTTAVRDALAAERESTAYLRTALAAEQARPRSLWDRLFGRRALPAPSDRS